jgi:ATP-dependent Clp protease ATP-binding subunit ClpX
MDFKDEYRQLVEEILFGYYEKQINEASLDELQQIIRTLGLHKTVNTRLKEYFMGNDAAPVFEETLDQLEAQLVDDYLGTNDPASFTNTPILDTNISHDSEQQNQPTIKDFTPKEMYTYLNRYVVGQDSAKRVVSVAAYNHYKRVARKHEINVPLQKSNILMVGPTGCGKTHIARMMARFLNVPFHIADATEFTSAGYYGKDVEVMIGELLHQTGMDVEQASKGIIFIDEIDKISSKSDPAKTGAEGRDIGGLGVQQGLLKMLEGKKMYVPINVTQHWSKHDFVEIDTSDILFICSGAFVGMENVMKDNKKKVGFAGGDSMVIPELELVDNDVLKKYGMIPEMLGRLPVKVMLHELTVDDLVKILTEVDDCILKEYVELFRLDHKTLHLTPQALRFIAEYALKRNVGARGLRSIMEFILRDYMFEGPADPTEKEIKVKITRKALEANLRSK